MKSRVLARRLVALRLIAFAIQLAAGGACVISKDLTSSRASVDGKGVGGRCCNHYLRALVADHQWVTCQRDPKALSNLVGEAADHYVELSLTVMLDLHAD